MKADEMIINNTKVKVHNNGSSVWQQSRETWKKELGINPYEPSALSTRNVGCTQDPVQTLKDLSY